MVWVRGRNEKNKLVKKRVYNVCEIGSAFLHSKTCTQPTSLAKESFSVERATKSINRKSVIESKKSYSRKTIFDLFILPL